MSMTPQDPAPARAADPAERALFRRLVDDAAVFPPGLAPLPRAVEEHLARAVAAVGRPGRPAPRARRRGAELLAVRRAAPLDVALVARPGTALDVVERALDQLGRDATLTVVGAEIAWSERVARVAGLGPARVRGGPARPDLVPRWRTSGTTRPARARCRPRCARVPPTRPPVPDATELATFLRTCVDMDLGFKLTGGLHRAVAHTTADGEDQHGFLNVLCATRWALAHAAEVPELVALLSERDPAPCVDILTGMSHADASVVRAFFTAYGCCGVTDPVHDLSTLGLITETA